MSAGLLEEILAHKREEVEKRKRKVSEDSFREMARETASPGGLTQALRQKTGEGSFAVIAELKKASPSKGVLRADFNPSAIAAGYQRGGAAALSVLTDARYFQGGGVVLEFARRGSSLPILRKDFIIDPYQVTETLAMGASGLLLIVAALPGDELGQLHTLARAAGLDVLVEVHDEAEMERAVALGAELIGVNNRNLQTFEVDLATTERLAPMLPESAVLVAESGIHGRADLERLRDCGAGAFLIGEHLMKAEDPGAALAELLA